MGDILSQDEVNALLKGISEGEIPPASGGGAAPGGVRPLDLTNQERDLRGRLLGLEQANERLVRSLRSSLGSFLGQLPAVSLGGLEMLRFSTFLDHLPTPASLHLFRLAPLRGQGLVFISPELLASLVEVSFGGSAARRTAAAGREYSAAECWVARQLAERLLAELRQTWAPLAEIEFAYVREETNPQFAAVAPREGMVVVSTLRVELGGAEAADLVVVVPDASLEPLRPVLRSGGAGVDEQPDRGGATWAAALREAVLATELEVRAELGSQLLPMRRVLALRRGDLLGLGGKSDAPVVVRVEGRPLFFGTPGVAGSQNAVRVLRRAPES